MRRFRDFLALVKIGIVATNALTALAGFALAAVRNGGPPPLRLGALLFAGCSLLVGGSCAINNWIDRDIDARMERTKDRPTARGAIGAAGAIGVGVGLSAAGLACLYAASPASALVGLAGAAVYVLAYTKWAKRRGAYSSFVGAVAGATPPLIGWAAIDPRLGGPAWALFALLVVWQQAHVRALALRRAGEYRAAGIPMPGDSSTRSRAELLAWVAACLPFPALAIALAGFPLEGPLAFPAIAAIIGSSALGAAWLTLGAAWSKLDRARLRSPAWPTAMFVASLAYLILVFAALFAIGL